VKKTLRKFDQITDGVVATCVRQKNIPMIWALFICGNLLLGMTVLFVLFCLHLFFTNDIPQGLPSQLMLIAFFMMSIPATIYGYYLINNSVYQLTRTDRIG
jgi:high-affinity K+ transport system ATPase subunit B